MKKTNLIITGPLPPPYFGVSNATDITLTGLEPYFRIQHLDTSDKRNTLNFGKYDFHNIYLGLKSLFECLKLLLKNPEVIYIPISQSYPAYFRDAGFILLGRLFRKKIVLHLRGGYFREFYESEKGIRKFLIRITVGMADKVIVLGHSLKYIFEGLTKQENIEVVSNGVDTDFYKPDHNKRNTGKFRICFISNYEQSKGWKEILECALRIRNEIDSDKFEIVMAGKWRCKNDEEYAKSFISKNKLESVVKIHDSITGQEKVELLQSSHLFLMPTSYRYEGQPWAIIEAMACGLPVISSPRGCIEETVTNGKNGYIITHDDIEGMKNLILGIMRNPELQNRLSLNSRKFVIEKFSQEIFLNNLREVLNNV